MTGPAFAAAEWPAARAINQPRHRYIVADLLTDVDQGLLPLSGVSYSRRVSTQGDLSGTFALSSSSTAALARLMNSRPCALYAERQVPGRTPELWWGGVVWSCLPSKDRRGNTTAQIQAATFDSLAGHRKLWDDVTYTDLDPVTRFRNLWTHMQTGPNAGYGITVGAEARAGGLDTVTYRGYDDAWYADLMLELTSGDDGFEWTIDLFRDGAANRVKQLRIGDPVLGRSDTPHLLTRPGNLVSWRWPGDLVRAGTHFRARGAAVVKNVGGSVVPIVSEVATADTLLVDGYPRLDVGKDFDEPDPAVIDTQARGMRDQAAQAQLVPEVTVRISDTTFAPGNLGDYTRTVIVDPFFALGRLDATWRAIGLTVNPAERGRDEEATVELLPEEDT